MNVCESDVKRLGRMANLVLSCLTREEAEAVAARFLPLIFPEEKGALFIRHSAQDLYEPVVCWGASHPWAAFTSQDCWSLRRRRIHMVREEKDQPLCPHATHDPEKCFSICIPMTVREDVLGVFHLLIPVADRERQRLERDSENPLEEKRRLAALIADVLALLLVNLRLRKQIDDLSVRDALTGCFNRRYLEESLPRTLKVAQRTGAPVAVILMDIDHFGQFTEAFGHSASDQVMQDLGSFLKKHLREADVPCRYGADEFALILPDTPLDTCRRRAEHLQSMIRDLALKDGYRHMRRITLSMGIAACPEQGETLCDLMEAAKTALKKAKQTGRDRIIVGE